MPFIWTEPAVYLLHNGVTVYHVYKSDDMDQGAREYWYGTSVDCSDCVGHGENGTFDVREFVHENDGDEFSPDTDDGRRALMRRAIEHGVIIDEDKD